MILESDPISKDVPPLRRVSPASLPLERERKRFGLCEEAGSEEHFSRIILDQKA